MPSSLERCVEAIRRAVEAPEELIVVDAPANAGPAAARNEGARRATGDVLVFVDSDVLVHEDAFARIRRHFETDPGLGGVFGAYDDAPAAPGRVSRFRNLLHHHVHHASPGRAATFWAGLGAIRREAFVEHGGFDEGRYPRPAIEDIELGMRLVAGDERLSLDPSIQGTHLKRWTLAGMVRSDFFDRGIPWAELILENGAAGAPLNLGWRHRASAVASVALLAGVATRRARLSLLALSTVAALNRDFYALLARRQGAGAVPTGVALHVIHHLTGVAAFGAATIAKLAADRSRSGG
jgi:Glycosyl transferase family 2